MEAMYKEWIGSHCIGCREDDVSKSERSIVMILIRFIQISIERLLWIEEVSWQARNKEDQQYQGSHTIVTCKAN